MQNAVLCVDIPYVNKDPFEAGICFTDYILLLKLTGDFKKYFIKEQLE